MFEVSRDLLQPPDAPIAAHTLREVPRERAGFSPNPAEGTLGGQRKLRNRHGLLLKDGVRLTLREVEIFQQSGEGLANKQMAAELGISIKTVEKHRQNLMEKLRIHNAAGLTRHAIALGIIA